MVPCGRPLLTVLVCQFALFGTMSFFASLEILLIFFSFLRRPFLFFPFSSSCQKKKRESTGSEVSALKEATMHALMERESYSLYRVCREGKWGILFSFFFGLSVYSSVFNPPLVTSSSDYNSWSRCIKPTSSNKQKLFSPLLVFRLLSLCHVSI